MSAATDIRPIMKEREKSSQQVSEPLSVSTATHESNILCLRKYFVKNTNNMQPIFFFFVSQ